MDIDQLWIFSVEKCRFQHPTLAPTRCFQSVHFSPIDLSQDLASGSGHDSVAVVVGHSVFIARLQDHV